MNAGEIIAWQRALSLRPDITVLWFKDEGALAPDVGIVVQHVHILAGPGNRAGEIVVRRCHPGTMSWPIDWPDTDVRTVRLFDYGSSALTLRPVFQLVDAIVTAARQLAENV